MAKVLIKYFRALAKRMKKVAEIIFYFSQIRVMLGMSNTVTFMFLPYRKQIVYNDIYLRAISEV